MNSQQPTALQQTKEDDDAEGEGGRGRLGAPGEETTATTAASHPPNITITSTTSHSKILSAITPLSEISNHSEEEEEIHTKPPPPPTSTSTFFFSEDLQHHHDENDDDATNLTLEDVALHEEATSPPAPYNHHIKKNISKIKLLIYISHFLTSWGDRMWSFANPLVLASIYTSSMFPVAAFSAFSFILCAFLGPHIGHLVDRYSRMKVVGISLLIQNLCVSMSAGCILVLYLWETRYAGAAASTAAVPATAAITAAAGGGGAISIGLLAQRAAASITNSTTAPASLWAVYWPFSNVLCALLFWCSTLIGGISALSSMASSVSVLKDWTVVISKSCGFKLEHFNANLRRLDLFCNILAPICFALVFQFIGPLIAILFVTCWNVVSFFPEYLCLTLVHREVPELGAKKLTQPDSKKRADNFVQILIKGWKLYYQQDVFAASISIVLLYFTVLHLGGVMMSFLASDDVNMQDWVIGALRAGTAVTGILGTIAAPILIDKLGIRKGGLLGIWYQLACLLISCAFLAAFEAHKYFRVFPVAAGSSSSSSTLMQSLIVLFVSFIILSRVGLWTFDLAETQIMQLGIKEQDRGVVNGTESSLQNVAELCILLLTLVVSNPDFFWILVLFSVTAVIVAALLFTMWTIKHSDFGADSGQLRQHDEKEGQEEAAAAQEVELKEEQVKE